MIWPLHSNRNMHADNIVYSEASTPDHFQQIDIVYICLVLCDLGARLSIKDPDRHSVWLCWIQMSENITIMRERVSLR